MAVHVSLKGKVKGEERLISYTQARREGSKNSPSKPEMQSFMSCGVDRVEQPDAASFASRSAKFSFGISIDTLRLRVRMGNLRGNR